MITIKEIMNYLPHRYPFLLVDRVVETDEKRIVTIKNVTINEPFFQGHFPGEPIMPGVLIIEAMAQSWGILAFHQSPEKTADNLNVRFIGIDKCRFRRPVVPGDQIRFELEGISQKRTIWKVRGKAFVDNNLAAEAELMVAM
jgi:beta-hydroxyacyl-ACP dehydratase FabZ